MNLSTNIKFSNNLIKNKTCTITYSGFLFENNSEFVSIVYGYENEWKHTTEQMMERTENGFVAELNILDYNSINFCFRNSVYEWDNNNSQNYTAPIIEVQEEPETEPILPEANFIINDESVITGILTNLYSIDVSSVSNETLSFDGQTIDDVAATLSKIIENQKETSEEETTFEIEVIENVPVSIEDSLVNSENADGLNKDLDQMFNDIYDAPIEENVVFEEVAKEEIIQTVEITENSTTEETVQTIETIEEPTVEENVQAIETVEEPIVEENVSEENSSFNMNNLIDEILSPIVNSSVFDEEAATIETVTSEENISTNFFEDFEDLNEDSNLDNKIDNLIADLFNNTKEFAKQSETVSEETTATYIDDVASAIEEQIQQIVNDDETLTEKQETLVTETNLEEIPQFEIETVENPVVEVKEEPVKFEKIPDFTILEDDEVEEESLLERDHTVSASTALIEVPGETDFVVSPRSLGKFYMFKKKVKLAFTKLFVALPRLFKKGFNTEND